MIDKAGQIGLIKGYNQLMLQQSRRLMKCLTFLNKNNPDNGVIFHYPGYLLLLKTTFNPAKGRQFPTVSE